MESDDVILARALQHANTFVRRLGLPASQHLLYDDIVQEAMVIALRKVRMIGDLEQEDFARWVRSTVFLVARNATRSEFRRTLAWGRLQGAFKHESMRVNFAVYQDGHTEALASAFAAVAPLDRALLLGKLWDGLTTVELAARHGLTAKAVERRIARARIVVRKKLS